MTDKRIMVVYGQSTKFRLPRWLSSNFQLVYYRVSDRGEEIIDSPRPVPRRPSIIVVMEGCGFKLTEEISSFARASDTPVYRHIKSMTHLAAMTRRQKEGWIYDLWWERYKGEDVDELREDEAKKKAKPKRFFKSWQREIIALLLKRKVPMTAHEVKEILGYPNAHFSLSQMSGKSKFPFLKSEPLVRDGCVSMVQYRITNPVDAWSYLCEDREPDFPPPWNGSDGEYLIQEMAKSARSLLMRLESPEWDCWPPEADRLNRAIRAYEEAK